MAMCLGRVCCWCSVTSHDNLPALSLVAASKGRTLPRTVAQQPYIHTLARLQGQTIDVAGSPVDTISKCFAKVGVDIRGYCDYRLTRAALCETENKRAHYFHRFSYSNPYRVAVGCLGEGGGPLVGPARLQQY